MSSFPSRVSSLSSTLLADRFVLIWACARRASPGRVRWLVPGIPSGRQSIFSIFLVSPPYALIQSSNIETSKPMQ